MGSEDIVKGKRILAVDDEEDVLEVIRDQLHEADLVTATEFESARSLLLNQRFDLIILDIMGVKGFDLLELSTEQKFPAVILTAHAVTPQSLQESIDKGAVSFLPKDELSNLSELIAEILSETAKGKTHWHILISRLEPKFKELWGAMWEEIRFPRDPKIGW